MSLGTAAQQAEFDSFFAEEEDDNMKGILDTGLSGSIGSGQPAQLATSGGVASQPNNAAVGVSWWRRCFFIFAIETYQPFFDVDTVDIQQRILFSLKFFNETNGFWNKVLPRTTSHQPLSNDLPYPGQQPQQQLARGSSSSKPDVYGPFWMATSLILVVSVSHLHVRLSALRVILLAGFSKYFLPYAFL